MPDPGELNFSQSSLKSALGTVEIDNPLRAYYEAVLAAAKKGKPAPAPNTDKFTLEQLQYILDFLEKNKMNSKSTMRDTLAEYIRGGGTAREAAKEIGFE